MEARIARLESDVEYIKRDIGEIKETLKGHDGKFDGLRADIHKINLILALATGIIIVITAVGGWIVNNRFDQILNAIAK